MFSVLWLVRVVVSCFSPVKDLLSISAYVFDVLQSYETLKREDMTFNYSSCDLKCFQFCFQSSWINQ